MPRGKSTEMSAADRMRAHAAAVYKIPWDDQFKGGIQAVVSIALEDLARWMDEQERK